MKLFIGSTYADLVAHRERVIEVLRRYACRLEAMELWEAKPEDPLSVCLEKVLESDVYLCIVGFRYGSTTETGKSYTETEFELALNEGKKILAFLMDESHPLPAKHVDFGSQREKVERFRASIRGRFLVSQFKSESELASKVVQSVAKLFSDLGLGPSGVPDPEDLWTKSVRAWETAAPEDMRVPFDPNDNPLDLLTELDSLVDAVERFQKDMADSNDRLNDDILAFLRDQSIDTSRLHDLPYYENPFIHRNWERVTFFTNVVTSSRIKVAQVRVRYLELLEAHQGSGPDIQRRLQKAKRLLKKAASRGVLVD